MIRSRIVLAFLLVVVLLATTKSFGDVYLNRLWDEDLGTFRVMAWDLGAGGVTIGRDYQNAYGDFMGYDSGPPFFIEAPIIAAGEVDDSGEVVSVGSLTFVGSVGLLQMPFDVIFLSAPNVQGSISINGPVNFLGTPLDPIHVSGPLLIDAGHLGGTDPWNSGQHEMTWTNTEFSEVTVDLDTWNYSPIQFHGGHVTIQDCYFKGFRGFSQLLSYNPYNYAAFEPLWDFTMDNCLIENDSLTYLPMIFSNLRRVTFTNNHFVDNQFSENSSLGMVMFEDCGIGKVTRNTASHNDHNVIRWINAWVSDSATIRTNESLPLVCDEILIPPDSALAIRPGSLIKFYHSGGLLVEGRAWLDSVILTSFNDDSHGGDSDLDSIQDYIYHWDPDIQGNAGGITVEPTGYAHIVGSRLLYPEGGVYSEALVEISDCYIRDPEYFGIWLKSYGNEEYTIRKTSIARNYSTSGVNYSLMFDNAQGGSQRLWLDSVNIYDGTGDGVLIRTNSGVSNNVKLTNCRFVSNSGDGVQVEMWPQLDTIEIDNCSFIGNAQHGLYATNQYNDDTYIRLTNSLFVGNGHTSTLYYGGNIRDGIPRLVNNTFAYNRSLGVSIYEVADDSVRTINNLFYRNGNYGYALTDPVSSVLSHNAFYGNNDGVEEVYFRLPTGNVRTIEEIQAAGGDFATNLHVDPQLGAEEIGTITYLRYDTLQGVTMLAGQPNQFGGKFLRGTAICPDTTQYRWYWITLNTVDSLYVVGDLTEVATVGDGFRVFDHHLLDLSPLVDTGSTVAVVGSYDLDGDIRVIDGDQTGGAVVDIGVDEFDPNGGYQSPIRVLAPKAGDVIVFDDSCRVEWEASGIDSVRVVFTEDPDQGTVWWDTLVTSVPASDGSVWSILPYVLSGKCVIKVVDAADPAVYDISDRFIAKYPVLTALDRLNQPIEFTMGDHSWEFGNLPDSMWPSTWYTQFDYVTGIDTITGIAYPPYFANALYYNAKPEDFPDWPLWVRAFGVDECYVNLPTGLVYLPSALASWSDHKGAWRGSCYGFAVSSALAFFDSTTFMIAYPDVTPYSQLHTLPLNDPHRLVVNELLLHQFGQPHAQYMSSHRNDTPREVLAQVKELLGDNFTDGQALGIANSRRGGHAVFPYRLESDSADGLYRLYIYDSNYPDTGSYTELFVMIDSQANTWSYAEMPNYNDNYGRLFLMDSTSLYLNTPTLKSGLDSPMAMRKFPVAGTSEIYAPGATVVMVIDSANDTTGVLSGGEILDQSGGVTPVMPMTGDGPPIGYSLSEGSYQVQMASDGSTEMALSVWRDSALYRFSHSGVAPADLDVLTIDTGLAITNVDSSMKECQMVYLQVTPEQERQYAFTGLSIDGGDGYDLYAADDSTVSLCNHGGNATIEIQLWVVSDSYARIMRAEGVTIPLSGHATVIPDWSDPSLGSALLARDMDGNGTAEDTIQLDLILSADDNDNDTPLPDRYELGQNYPNPFNSSTVISYSLPERAQVKIDVFNVLGQKVRTLVSEDQAPGYHTVRWDGTDGAGRTVATGVYFYRFTSGDRVMSKKMLLVK